MLQTSPKMVVTEHPSALVHYSQAGSSFLSDRSQNAENFKRDLLRNTPAAWSGRGRVSDLHIASHFFILYMLSWRPILWKADVLFFLP